MFYPLPKKQHTALAIGIANTTLSAGTEAPHKCSCWLCLAILVVTIAASGGLLVGHILTSWRVFQ